MKKHEFKSRMSAYRKLVNGAAWRGKKAFYSARDSDLLCESCLKPRYLPVVSRNVMLHKFTLGGLEAVSSIDSVEIRYN